MSYAAIPYAPELREELAGLWIRNLSDPRLRDRVPARMSWLYGDGPEGPARTCLATEGSRIIGCGSFVPRTLVVDGQRLRAGVLADFAVDRAHRVAGAALAIQRALLGEREAAGVEALFGWPNRKSAAIFRRLGYASAGDTTSFAKPLRSRRHVASRLDRLVPAAAHRAARLAVGPAAHALDAALLADDLARVLPRMPTLRGELVARLDARADELFARPAPARVTGARTAAYLNWRYASFPTAEYRFFQVSARRDGALAGVLAFTLLGDGTASIADLVTDGAARSLDALLSWFALEARRAGASAVVLTALSGPELGPRLARLRFFPRPTERSLFVYAPGERRGLLTDASSWLVYDGELDI